VANVNGSFLYPDGINGTTKIFTVGSGATYTVPVGKTFYLLRACNDLGGTHGRLLVDGRYAFFGTGTGQINIGSCASNPAGAPVIVPGGSVLSVGDSGYGGGLSFSLNGYETMPLVTARLFTVTGSASYTVPAEKTLYLLRACNDLGGTHGRLLVDKRYAFFGSGGGQINIGSCATNPTEAPLMVPSGSVLSVADSGYGSNLSFSLNGYEASRLPSPAAASGTPAVSAISELNGKVGIGTSTPGQKLSVAGTIESQSGGFKFPDGTVQATAGGGSGSSVPSPWAVFGPAINYLSGNVGIGIAAPAQKLSVAGAIESTSGGFKFPDGTVQTTAGAGAPSRWSTTGSNVFFNSGNVGIGTSTPTSTLHLDGDLTISKSGTTYLTTETNTYPMIIFKSPPYGVTPPTFGRVGLYADTAFLSDNVFYDVTKGWARDNYTWGGSVVLLQQGVIRFQTQAPNGPDGVINRMFIGRDVTMAFNTADEKVGIGTNTPSAKLHVVGDVVVDGNIAAKYQDVAEWVEACEAVSPGTVMVISGDARDVVCESDRGYDTSVAGVVSARPGLSLGEQSASKVLVAQSGRVLVKVDASYGAIRAGDLLVTSPTPGVAMRSEPIAVGATAFHRPGTLLGKALESLASGKGEILVLLTLQ
jgi:hypothetical protein